MKTSILTAFLCIQAIGCGSKTGLLTPDVPTDVQARDDVPSNRDPLCVDVPPGVGTVTVNLETRVQLAVADIFFVIDRTGSMQGEIDNIKANLQSTIVPSVARTIGDVQFGVATFADFPVDPYGETGDVPFTLVTPIDPSVPNVQGAVNGIRVDGGGDLPEATTEALFQVASGEGYAPWITPSSPCASPSRVGYGCLRPNAQSIFVLITDAPMHNGPSVRFNYTGSNFTSPARCPSNLPNCRANRGPHSYQEMIDAVNRVHARVIGISSGTEGVTGRDDMIRIAQDTGSVTSTGAPLVFDIGSDGRDLDSRVVSAIQTFTQQVRFNASARVLDLDPRRSVRAIVQGVRPLRADPMSNVTGTTADSFTGVVPGTRLTFAIDLATDLPRMALPQRFPARVQFYGDGRANLGSRDITIVIPAENGDGCQPGSSATDAGTIDASAATDL